VSESPISDSRKPLAIALLSSSLEFGQRVAHQHRRQPYARIGSSFARHSDVTLQLDQDTTAGADAKPKRKTKGFRAFLRRIFSRKKKEEALAADAEKISALIRLLQEETATANARLARATAILEAKGIDTQSLGVELESQTLEPQAAGIQAATSIEALEEAIVAEIEAESKAWDAVMKVESKIQDAAKEAESKAAEAEELVEQQSAEIEAKSDELAKATAESKLAKESQIEAELQLRVADEQKSVELEAKSAELEAKIAELAKAITEAGKAKEAQIEAEAQVEVEQQRTKAALEAQAAAEKIAEKKIAELSAAQNARLEAEALVKDETFKTKAAENARAEATTKTKAAENARAAAEEKAAREARRAETAAKGRAVAEERVSIAEKYFEKERNEARRKIAALEQQLKAAKRQSFERNVQPDTSALEQDVSPADTLEVDEPKGTIQNEPTSPTIEDMEAERKTETAESEVRSSTDAPSIDFEQDAKPAEVKFDFPQFEIPRFSSAVQQIRSFFGAAEEKSASSSVENMSPEEIASRIAALRSRRAQLQEIILEGEREERQQATTVAAGDVVDLGAARSANSVVDTRRVKIRLPEDTEPGQTIFAAFAGGWDLQFLVPEGASPGMQLETDVIMKQDTGGETLDEDDELDSTVRCVNIRLPADAQPGEQRSVKLPGNWRTVYTIPIDASPGNTIMIKMKLESVLTNT